MERAWRQEEPVMDTSRVQRKRATVLNGDVAGFSRLMAADEMLTLDSLYECLELICELIGQYGGRLVDATGDNMMAEFADETSAVECAVRVQRNLAERNRRVGVAERLSFRFGLHSGSVLLDRMRLFGTVVNLAARLQAVAKPDGIVLSEAVAERASCSAVLRRMTDRGSEFFKNIPIAMRTFEIAEAE
jgi:adenylate cyclase